MLSNRSVEKRLRQSEKKRTRNQKAKSTMKTSIKKTVLAIKYKQTDIIKKAIKIIAKTAAKGIIHKKNASHKISKIMYKNYLLNKQNI